MSSKLKKNKDNKKRKLRVEGPHRNLPNPQGLKVVAMTLPLPPIYTEEVLMPKLLEKTRWAVLTENETAYGRG